MNIINVGVGIMYLIIGLGVKGKVDKFMVESIYDRFA